MANRLMQSGEILSKKSKFLCLSEYLDIEIHLSDYSVINVTRIAEQLSRQRRILLICL